MNRNREVGDRSASQVSSPDKYSWRRKKAMAGVTFMSPQAIGLAVFMAVPIVMSAVMSLFDWPMLGERSFIGLENYRKLFAAPSFLHALRNTVIYVVLYLTLNLIVSIAIAGWLSGPNIRHRQFFRVLFFLPTVTPMVANVVIWKLLYQPDGAIDATIRTIFRVDGPDFLNNSYWAMPAIVLMSVWQGFGYNMLIFSSALDNVPEDIVQAADIDGASRWVSFFKIKLPLISPSVFFASTMTMITAFQLFTQPFILTKGGPGDSTITLVYFIYNQGFIYQNLGFAAAAAWLMFMIILIITAIQFVGEKRWVFYA